MVNGSRKSWEGAGAGSCAGSVFDTSVRCAQPVGRRAMRSALTLFAQEKVLYGGAGPLARMGVARVQLGHGTVQHFLGETA